MEAFKLSEYEDIDKFVIEYDKIQKRLKTLKRLEDAENMRQALSSMQGKKGASIYSQWRRNLLDTIKEEPEEQETIFSRSKNKKKNAVKKVLTIFEKNKNRRRS